jgi:hypothetical protein
VISPSTAHGILRVVAFILLCIGVQIACNGLAVLISWYSIPDWDQNEQNKTEYAAGE